jgi:membrane fusion protein, multidrug efflux system
LKHRILVPMFVVLGTLGTYFWAKESVSQPVVVKPVDTLKKVDIHSLKSEEHQVTLKLHGFVQPQETTWLSSEVSGSITYIDENLIKGGMVNKGDLLVSIDKRAYQAKVLNAKAEVMFAEAELIEEQALADVAQSETVHHPQKSYTDLFLRKPQLLSAKAKLISAQADLRQAQINLEKCDIRAPIDGLVISRDIGLGQVILANTRLAQLDSTRIAEIVAAVPNFERQFLSPELSGKSATVYSYDGQAHDGVVARELGTIDKNTSSTHLVIQLPSPYETDSTTKQFKFGDFVTVNLNSMTLSNVYKVPQHLVNENKVWLVDQEGTLQSTAVNVVRKEGEFYYIKDGLDDGDRLVMSLPEYPVDGLAVQVVSENTMLASQQHSQEAL